MIGGRVLDATAVHAIVTGSSEYAQALLTVATDLGIPLAVPATALQAAWQEADPKARPWLDLLPEAATVVVLDLTAQVARDAGLLAADSGHPGAPASAGHAVAVALERSWPVVTRHPDVLLALSPDVRTETIP